MVLTQNNARYRANGAVVEVPGKCLLTSARKVYAPLRAHRGADSAVRSISNSRTMPPCRRVNPAFALEVLPNRDSLPYADLYGIPKVESMFRGTLRYEVCAGGQHAEL